jgi:transcriptional regulator with XRE-family HTH domain
MADRERWKQIGERIGALIRLKGYTSIELFAHEHGVDKSVLNRLINGKREVRLSTFLRIADALEIGMEGLEGRPNLGSLVRETPLEEGLPKSKGSAPKIRVLKLTLPEFDRIEIRKTARDKQPVILESSQEKSTSALKLQTPLFKLEF